MNERYLGMSVEVLVTYQESADLAGEAGEEVLARFDQLPIPQDWVGFNRSTSLGEQLMRVGYDPATQVVSIWLRIP